MQAEQRFIHVCEVCGKTKIMTPEQAFNEGWDYPPRMGAFGIVSPRTCGDCSMMDTLWMALQSGKIKGIDDDEAVLQLEIFAIIFAVGVVTLLMSVHILFWIDILKESFNS